MVSGSAVPLVTSTRSRLSGFRWRLAMGFRKEFEARADYLFVGSPDCAGFFDVVL